jgi:DNA replication licensing factor MCM5
MRLSPFATNADVDEALRLFQVSTLDAAMSGNLSGLSNIITFRGYQFSMFCCLLLQDCFEI